MNLIHIASAWRGWALTRGGKWSPFISVSTSSACTTIQLRTQLGQSHRRYAGATTCWQPWCGFCSQFLVSFIGSLLYQKQKVIREQRLQNKRIMHKWRPITISSIHTKSHTYPRILLRIWLTLLLHLFAYKDWVACLNWKWN